MRRVYPGLITVRAAGWIGALFFFTSCISLAWAEEWRYTTRPGDSLWSISETYLLGTQYVTRLQRHNQIKNPKVLPPGMVLRVPVAWMKFKPRPAIAIEVTGEVTMIREPGATPQVLVTGAELYSGYELRTAPGANVTVEFADGSRFMLHGDSTVNFDSLTSFENTGMVDTRLRLQRGRLDNRVTPLKAPGSRYEITSPSAIAAVRGTEFRISVADDQSATRAEVLEHAVEVMAAGVSRDVPADFGTVTQRGKPPEEPQALLPAPDLTELPQLSRATRVQLQWPPVTEAAGYRMEISPIEAFTSLLRDVMTAEPRVALDNLPMGPLYLRVRAIAANGLEGRDAHHRLYHDAPIRMPELMQPMNDEVVASMRRVQFKWSTIPDAAVYRLQIARDESFFNPVLDQTLAETSFETAVLQQAGTWYWRVKGYDADNNAGELSAPSRLLVREPPAAVPGMELIEQEGKLVWPKVQNAQRYQVEIAGDPVFKEIKSSSEVTETSYDLSRLGTGTYWLRVRVIDDLDMRSAYSDAVQYDVQASTPWWPLLFIFFVPWL